MWQEQHVPISRIQAVQNEDVPLPARLKTAMHPSPVTNLLLPNPGSTNSLPQTTNTHTHPRYPPSNHRYYIAINLYNSSDIIPDLFATLFRVASILGFQNVYVPFYENCSADQTKPSVSS